MWFISDRDVGRQQAGDRLVDAAVVTQPADRADPCAAHGHRRERHQRQRNRAGRPAEQHRRRPGADAAERDGALPADHHEAEPGGQRDAERGQQQRRGARQRVLPAERGAEPRAPDQRVELRGRLAERREEQAEGGEARQ
jgi:hypothetical protein